jgi:DNA-binding MarR family transcriptional regulator
MQQDIFTFQRPEQNPGYLLWQVSMQWQLSMKHALDPLGITMTQFSLLAAAYWLLSTHDVVTQNDVAQHAHVDKMTTSKVVATLEAKQFLVRTRHQTDTRAKCLQITEDGISLLRLANAAVEHTDRAFFGRLGDQHENYLLAMQKLENNETQP